MEEYRESGKYRILNTWERVRTDNGEVFHVVSLVNGTESLTMGVDKDTAAIFRKYQPVKDVVLPWIAELGPHKVKMAEDSVTGLPVTEREKPHRMCGDIHRPYEGGSIEAKILHQVMPRVTVGLSETAKAFLEAQEPKAEETVVIA